ACDAGIGYEALAVEQGLVQSIAVDRVGEGAPHANVEEGRRFQVVRAELHEDVIERSRVVADDTTLRGAPVCLERLRVLEAEREVASDGHVPRQQVREDGVLVRYDADDEAVDPRP